ncbi:MAG: DUF5410 family protein [Candidatus Rickettsia vulgarisii]
MPKYGEKNFVDKQVIDNIISGKVTKGDLINLSNYFSLASAKEVRDDLVESLGKNLSKEALHKLNSAIMESADILLPKNDNKFLCRTTGAKFFKDLLVLEAKNSGMKVEFGNNGQVVNTTIPPEILDHYATLKENFYKKRGVSENDLNQNMAESMAFILVDPIAKETGYYKNQQSSYQIMINSNIINSKGEVVSNLVKSNIAEKAKHQNKNIIDKYDIPLQEIKEQNSKVSVAIMDSIAPALSKRLVNQALDQLKDNNIIIDDKEKSKIQGVLSDSIKKVPAQFLLNQPEDLVEQISKHLIKGQTTGSQIKNVVGINKKYSVSTSRLNEIGKEIGKAFSNNPESISQTLIQQARRLGAHLKSKPSTSRPNVNTNQITNKNKSNSRF